MIKCKKCGTNTNVFHTAMANFDNSIVRLYDTSYRLPDNYQQGFYQCAVCEQCAKELGNTNYAAFGMQKAFNNIYL